jgi:hypothetical protein
MGKIFKGVSKAIGGVLGVKAPKMPRIPDPVEPPARQEARVVDYNNAMQTNKRKRRTTLLTGAAGGEAPSSSLGSNTLLGG